jgi:succinate dehydrogenase / fumarate reductase, cytochrome b subunit
VPLGVFLIIHLLINARALQGRDALDRTVRGLLSIPLLPVIEIFGVLVPLGFHAAYGIKLSLVPRAEAAPYPARWVLLQRVTGVVALLFIAFHLYDLRGRVLLGYMTEADVFPALAAKLSSTTSWGIPLAAAVYLTGVAATVFHFSTGLFAFAVAWGYAVSERAIRNARIACGSVGVLLFLIGAATVVYYATGSRFFFTQLGPPYHYCDRFPWPEMRSPGICAESDPIVLRLLPATNESTGLAGSSRGSWSFVPIVI